MLHSKSHKSHAKWSIGSEKQLGREMQVHFKEEHIPEETMRDSVPQGLQSQTVK